MDNKIYTALLGPVVTEKTARLTESGKYTFYIHPTATKKNVAKAIKQIYGSEVKKVNIVKARSKSKWGRARNLVAKRSSMTKAIVTMKDKKSIDLNKIA